MQQVFEEIKINTEGQGFYNFTENTLNWIDTGFTVASKDAENNFKERNITVSDIPNFTKVVVKIVMKSTDTASVPKVQAFRLICHS